MEVTLTEAALALGVSWIQAQRLLLTGALKGRKDGRTWRVTQQSIDQYQHVQAGSAPRHAA